MGIPESRIFTINPQGEVKHEVSRSFQSSYSKLCDYVDLIFPPFKANTNDTKTEYHSFNYWRTNPVANDEYLSEIEEELKKVAALTKAASKDTKASLKEVKSVGKDATKNATPVVAAVTTANSKDSKENATKKA